MTDEDLQQIGQLITTRLDRAVETIADEISARSEAADRRFTAIDGQLEGIHNRLERTNATLTALHGSITALNFWADRTDQIHADHLSATAQAIADITRRLEALEKKAS